MSRIKDKSHDIKKTFKNLPAGKHQISLDFFKIDSWLVKDRVSAEVRVGNAFWSTLQGQRICLCVSERQDSKIDVLEQATA